MNETVKEMVHVIFLPDLGKEAMMFHMMAYRHGAVRFRHLRRPTRKPAYA